MKYVILYSYIWLIMLAGWLVESLLGDCMVMLGIVILASAVYNELYGRLYVKGYRVI